MWGLGAPTPHFSLEGHERGVNAIDYYPGGDRPYLLSGKYLPTLFRVFKRRNPHALLAAFHAHPAY